MESAEWAVKTRGMKYRSDSEKQENEIQGNTARNQREVPGCLIMPKRIFAIRFATRLKDFFIFVAFLDDLNLLVIIRCEVGMKNVVHPQSGVDVRQVFDKFPYVVELCLAVYEAEEVAADLFLFPQREMSLDQAAERAVHPLGVDERAAVLL